MPYQDLQILKRIDYHDLESQKVKISPFEFYNAIREIADFLSDDMLGLRVGQHLTLHTLGVVYRISLKTKNLMEALHYCHDYLQKTLPCISIRKSKTNKVSSFTLKIDCLDKMVARHVLETVLSVMAREIILASGKKTSITIFSPHKNNEYPDNWQKGNEFRISFKAYNKYTQNMESLGLGVLIPEYLHMTEEIKDETSFRAIIKMSVLRMSRPKLPDVDRVAYNLNMKTRTLQRRLMDEGTSFRQISEELKRQISDLLLQHPDVTIADISTILGYSEPSSFIHSFMKWHGKSPSQIRNMKFHRKK